MKKTFLLCSLALLFLKGTTQVNQIDFGNNVVFFSCDPPVFTTTNQIQCSAINPVATPVGNTVMYYTTAAGQFGQDCRNWLRLSNPGFSFIGLNSELQLRNAGNGSTILNPARFLVKDFIPGTRFGITFDIALAGYGGVFYFRCGSGQAYGDTVYMTSRDSSSFTVVKIDAANVLTTPMLRYSSSAANTLWPNVPSYSFVPGINSMFPIYQKHTVAIFCNNTSTPFSYDYIGTKILNPQSYDVYLDSVLDVDNMFDDFFGLNRPINSFMFAGSDALCANNGPYLGDTLIVDNIRWSSDLISSPLPVHLSSFTARLVGNNTKTILLNWRDETPEEGTRFDVEVSTDGFSFKNIGHIIGQENQKDYSFLCSYMGCGKIFFRLAYKEKNEKKYSETRIVNISCNVSITTIDQSLRIQTKYAGTLTLISSSGQTLTRINLASGYSQVPLAIPRGVYIARFIDYSGTTYIEKIIVQ